MDDTTATITTRLDKTGACLAKIENTLAASSTPTEEPTTKLDIINAPIKMDIAKANASTCASTFTLEPRYYHPWFPTYNGKEDPMP